MLWDALVDLDETNSHKFTAQFQCILPTQVEIWFDFMFFKSCQKNMLQQHTISERENIKAMLRAYGYPSRFFDKLVQQFYSHNGSNQSSVNTTKLLVSQPMKSHS